LLPFRFGPLLSHLDPRIVSDEGGKKDEDNELGRCAEIEIITSSQKKGPPEPERNREIDGDDESKKN
jgi:hypothetical protein